MFEKIIVQAINDLEDAASHDLVRADDKRAEWLEHVHGRVCGELSDDIEWGLRELKANALPSTLLSWKEKYWWFHQDQDETWTGRG